MFNNPSNNTNSQEPNSKRSNYFEDYLKHAAKVRKKNDICKKKLKKITEIALFTRSAGVPVSHMILSKFFFPKAVVLSSVTKNRTWFSRVRVLLICTGRILCTVSQMPWFFEPMILIPLVAPIIAVRIVSSVLVTSAVMWWFTTTVKSPSFVSQSSMNSTFSFLYSHPSW